MGTRVFGFIGFELSQVLPKPSTLLAKIGKEKLGLAEWALAVVSVLTARS